MSHGTAAGLDPPRVLVVEDDYGVRMITTQLLKEEGYRVTATADAREAAVALDAAPVDVIVLDLMLPAVDGWQFRESLSRDPRLQHTPVVVISAVPEQDARNEGLRVAAYVRKPFALSQLAGAVARALASRSVDR